MKEKELLSGATTKNLNRVHLGYHYPRDKETVFQSQKGFYSFTKLYSHSIIKKFEDEMDEYNNNSPSCSSCSENEDIVDIN